MFIRVLLICLLLASLTVLASPASQGVNQTRDGSSEGAEGASADASSEEEKLYRPPVFIEIGLICGLLGVALGGSLAACARGCHAVTLVFFGLAIFGLVFFVASYNQVLDDDERSLTPVKLSEEELKDEFSAMFVGLGSVCFVLYLIGLFFWCRLQSVNHPKEVKAKHIWDKVFQSVFIGMGVLALAVCIEASPRDFASGTEKSAGILLLWCLCFSLPQTCWLVGSVSPVDEREKGDTESTPLPLHAAPAIQADDQSGPPVSYRKLSVEAWALYPVFLGETGGPSTHSILARGYKELLAWKRLHAIQLLACLVLMLIEQKASTEHLAMAFIVESSVAIICFAIAFASGGSRVFVEMYRIFSVGMLMFGFFFMVFLVEDYYSGSTLHSVAGGMFALIWSQLAWLLICFWSGKFWELAPDA